MKLNTMIKKIKQWQLAIIVILLNFLNSFVFSRVASLFYITLNKGFNDHYSVKEKIILFVIAGPIIETFLFQYAVIEISRSKKIALKYCCLLSAFVFALSHLYNFFYFLYAFVAGLMFAYLYSVGKNSNNAIVLTLITHIIYNGIVFIMKFYFP